MSVSIDKNFILKTVFYSNIFCLEICICIMISQGGVQVESSLLIFLSLFLFIFPAFLFVTLNKYLFIVRLDNERITRFTFNRRSHFVTMYTSFANSEPTLIPKESHHLSSFTIDVLSTIDASLFELIIRRGKIVTRIGFGCCMDQDVIPTYARFTSCYVKDQDLPWESIESNTSEFVSLITLDLSR